MVDVFLNEKYIGTVQNAEEFVSQVKERRTTNKIPLNVNILHNH